MEISRPIPGWIPSTPDMRGPSFDDLAKRYPAIAIHFWAAWNGSDVVMDHSIQTIAGRFAGRVHFVSCNIDLEENVEVCRRSQFKNIPALVIWVAGLPHRPIIGTHDPEQLAIEIESRLRNPTTKRWWEFWRQSDG